MDKLDELQRLKQEMLQDKSLPLQESNLVFGEGDADGGVVFVGEAPGFYEDQLKRPFVGRAGQLLNRILSDIGWPRESVYITNIVKRRPPENRDPLPEEIEKYKPYLTRQIKILDPLVIVTLGRFAMNYFLPAAKISRDQGKVFKWVGPNGVKGEKWDGRFVVPMFHPAAALRSTQVLEELEASFKKLPVILAKCEQLSKEVLLAPGEVQQVLSQESLF